MNKFELLCRSFKRRGAINTLKFIFHDLTFDLGNGTDTAAEITAYEAEMQKSLMFAAPCQGANPWVVNECLAIVSGCGVNIENAIFLDIGSGKGRAMLLAAFAGFKKVLGVELDARLCLVAEENFKRCDRKLKGASYSIFNGDATVYILPDECDVVFMYNPFGVVVMRKVLALLLRKYSKLKEKSIQKPLHVIYVNPVCADVFIEFGIFPIASFRDEAFIYQL